MVKPYLGNISMNTQQQINQLKEKQKELIDIVKNMLKLITCDKHKFDGAWIRADGSATTVLDTTQEGRGTFAPGLARDPQTLIDDVNLLIESGWQPFGGIEYVTYDDNNLIIQTMVKYE